MGLPEAATEWVEATDGYRLRWTCPDCQTRRYTERYYGTTRCPHCSHIMQSASISVGEAEARPPDERKKQHQSALSW